MPRSHEERETMPGAGPMLHMEGLAEKLVSSALNGLYIFDVPEQALVFVNLECTRLTGYTSDHLSVMRTEGLVELCHPDDRERMQEHLGTVTAAGDGEINEIEYRLKTADGRWLWCRSRHTVFKRDPDGSVRQILGTLLDITDHKLAEEAVHESQAKLQAALTSMTDAVFIVL